MLEAVDRGATVGIPVPAGYDDVQVSTVDNDKWKYHNTFMTLVCLI